MAVPKEITQPSARRKLELSQVGPRAVQRETMGTDVDLAAFQLYLESQVRVSGLSQRIMDATISRTVDSSSLLSVTVNDYDRSLLNSGFLYNKLDVQVDGLWFRLSGVDLEDDEVTLNFEDREIALLRNYTKWRIARRSKITRAQFVKALIDEVKEVKIPVIIPELRTVQLVQRFDGDIMGQDMVVQKGKGINVGANQKAGKDANDRIRFFVGEAPATKEQLTNVKIILQVCNKEGASRKQMVVALMVATVESRIRNLPYGDLDSLGLFQQRGNWGTEAERLNPETSTKLFITMCKQRDKQFDYGLAYDDLAYATQYQGDPVPGGKGANYMAAISKSGVTGADIRRQAAEFVTAFGVPGGDKEGSAAAANNSYANASSGGEFFFYRGKVTNSRGKKIRKPEDSWDCIQRLADEVNWRAFFVSGVFYFISEDNLFKQEPLLRLEPFMEGIRSVSGNFYEKKRSAVMTITADVGRWSVPPGAVVEVVDHGPFNGRWLVSEYERSLFDLTATITLARERPSLPEPSQGNQNVLQGSWIPGGTVSSTVGGGTGTGAGTGETPNIQGFTQDLAQALLNESGKGWRDDNGRGTVQLRKLASGMRLANPFTGAPVDQDPRTLKVILWLIQKGYSIGTYAFTEDHDKTDDGHAGRGHVNGFCVDISSINGVGINQDTPAIAKDTFNVAKLLNTVKGELHPRQLICGGYGNHSNFAIRSLTIPSTDYYGEDTMADHTNHIHVGY